MFEIWALEATARGRRRLQTRNGKGGAIVVMGRSDASQPKSKPSVRRLHRSELSEGSESSSIKPRWLMAEGMKSSIKSKKVGC